MQFEASLADTPDDPETHYATGMCARFEGRWDAAAGHFRRVLELRLEHLDTLLQVAYVHEQKDEPAAALPFLEQAERQRPDRPAVQARLAAVCRALGQGERAAAHQKRSEAATAGKAPM